MKICRSPLVPATASSERWRQTRSSGSRSSVRSASEKRVSPDSNSLPRGPRESASIPIMSPVARSKTGWNTGWISPPLDRVLKQLPAPNLRAHGLARHLVARVLDAAIDQALGPVLRIVRDAAGADEGTEAPREIGPLGEISADQLVELRRLLLQRARVVQERFVRVDDEDDLVGAHERKTERAGGHDAVGLEGLQPAHEVEQQVVVGLVAPDLLDPPFRAGPEDQDRERAMLPDLLAELVGQRRERGQARVPVVQPGALLQPLTPKGDELALATLGAHRQTGPLRIAPRRPAPPRAGPRWPRPSRGRSGRRPARSGPPPPGTKRRSRPSRERRRTASTETP